VEEADLVKAVDKWASAECKRQDKKVNGENKRAVLGDMIYSLRLAEMTMSELSTVVASSGILSSEELLSVYTYLGATSDKKPSIKFNTTPREGGSSFPKSVILDSKQQKVLGQFFGKKNGNFKRIYQMTKDGSQCYNFHGKCSAYRSLLVIVKTTTNHVFGGYTSVGCAMNGSYMSDSKAFLFSLVNTLGKPIKLVSTGDSNSVYAESTSAAIAWGGGNDLMLGQILNSQDYNSSYCSTSYRSNDSSFTYSTSTQYQLFDASFACAEIEVYTNETKTV